MSVLKSKVPHKTEEEAEDRQYYHPKVKAALVFWAWGWGLLVDLSDQTVDYTVVSYVVILESVGVIAQILSIEDEPHQFILRKFGGKMVSTNINLKKLRIKVISYHCILYFILVMFLYQKALILQVLKS